VTGRFYPCSPTHLPHQLDAAQESAVVVRLLNVHKLHVVLVEHLNQHGLELFSVHRAAEAAHAVGDPRGVVLQQDHQVEAVFVDQRLHERMLAPFVLFVKTPG